MAIEFPLQLNDYGVWKEGWRFVGMSTTTLPNLANLTDTYKGAGHGGESVYPVRAHYADWEIVFNFHAISKQQFELLDPDGSMLEIMPGIEYQDPTSHKVRVRGWRISAFCTPKGIDLGTLEVGVKMNLAVPCLCTYIKGVFNGETIFEKDKVNIIDETLHRDIGREIRQAIGII